MKRPSIKATLIMVFVLIIAVASAIGYVAITGLRGTNGATTEIATNLLPSIRIVNAINTATSDYRIAEGAHIMSVDAVEMERAEKDVADKETLIETLRKQYEPLISSDEEQKLYDRFSVAWEDYLAIHNRTIELSRENKNEEAGTSFRGPMRIKFDEASKILSDIVELNNLAADKAYKDASKAFGQTLTITFVALGIMAVIVLGAAIFALSSIASPITRITDSMKNLAQGDTEKEIPFGGRQDEIGAMAGAVEIFRQAALANKRLEAEAEANRHKAEAERIAAQERAEADAAERLRIATSGLAAGLKQLAGGDLSFQLNEPFAPDFEALRHDFNQSVQQLGSTLAQISSAVSTIDNGSREISSGAGDLSKRTEQQAASLEETAAALDEITANVANSNKRTSEARQVAADANKSATQSAAVVSSAEKAMGRIEESSQEISNIIGVIDEIAFQTNLLALNAGVEAARAGEAGRGFAVVAQEVRELAQRSAQAAKEIKDLIQNSTVEVESGVKLVRDAGDALKSIGDFIVEINSHMEAIATSSQEQSTGLAEINVAVNSMDQSTQQNAAMVEQTTAASMTLAAESSRLQELIGQFKLAGMASSQSSALRNVAKTMAGSQPKTASNMPVRKQKMVASGGGGKAQGESWSEF